MTKVITFYNQKGGVGKTTAAFFFASYLSVLKGKSVAILDTDAQQSSFGIVALAEQNEIDHGFQVYTDIDEVPDGLDYLIVDVGGQISSWHETSDIVVIPARPHFLELHSTHDVLDDIKAPVFKFFMTNRRDVEEAETIENLKKEGFKESISIRSIIPRLTSSGGSLWKHKVPSGRRYGLSEAKEEYAELFRKILKVAK